MSATLETGLFSTYFSLNSPHQQNFDVVKVDEDEIPMPKKRSKKIRTSKSTDEIFIEEVSGEISPHIVTPVPTLFVGVRRFPVEIFYLEEIYNYNPKLASY